MFRALDMSDRDAVPALVDLHGQTFETMNALVLNAGVGTAGPMGTFKQARLDKTFEVNFNSAFVLLQRALPLLRAGAVSEPEHGSRVVGISSITGVYAEPGLAAYGASKAALMSLLATLNLEEASNGVLATAIAPAFVDTDMSSWVTDSIAADTMIRSTT